MPTFNFTDSDSNDIGNKYVTKDYLMDNYPNLLPAQVSPQLWLWGANLNPSGGLGDGTTSARSSPVTTAGSTATWKYVNGSGSNDCFGGIKSDGTLWTWGYNGWYNLGDATPNTNRSSPGTTAGGGTNWKQVAMGTLHCGGVKTDGTLWTWGGNGYGNLGDGTTTNRSSPGTTAGGGTNWKQLSIGNWITAAIKTDGTLWTWGYNNYGQLGDGTATDRSSPGTTAGGGTNWKQVSADKEGKGCAAIKTDGTLWTWGYNNYGQLGDGTTTSRSSPGQTAGGGTNWKQVAMGWSQGAAIKTDGTLWTWGTDYYGALGIGGSRADRSSPGTTAGGGTNWKYVDVGGWYKGAIKTDGSLWTWGRDYRWTLGTGEQNARSSPGTTAVNWTNWKQISTNYETMAGITEMGNW